MSGLVNGRCFLTLILQKNMSKSGSPKTSCTQSAHVHFMNVHKTFILNVHSMSILCPICYSIWRTEMYFQCTFMLQRLMYIHICMYFESTYMYVHLMFISCPICYSIWRTYVNVQWIYIYVRTIKVHMYVHVCTLQRIQILRKYPAYSHF